MRDFSAWSVAASLFFSIALCSSANDVIGTAVSLAAAGNPAAVEQSLSGFVSRMGGGVEMPKAVAAAAGHSVAGNAAAKARLERQKKWVIAQGTNDAMPTSLSGIFGLTDGKTGAPVRGLLWNDDNDRTVHICELVTDDQGYIVIAYKPADNSFAINWLTDVNGKLYRTVYVDKTGMRVVPNDSHAAEFNAQLSYWDNITPATTSIASAAGS